MASTLKRFAAFDGFRLVCALLVIAIHIGPFVQISPALHFAVNHVLARIAVPFFFMLSGYFLSKKLKLKKLFLLTVVAILLYLPLNLYSHQSISLMDLFVNGTFYHLWFLPALILGLCLFHGLSRFLSLRAISFICLPLYLIGLMGDSYAGLTQQIPFLSDFYRLYFPIFETTRNGLFFALPLITLGKLISTLKPMQLSTTTIGLTISTLLLFLEAGFVAQQGWVRTDCMTIALPFVMFFLVEVLSSFEHHGNPTYRKTAMLVYLIHPWVLVLVRGFAKGTHTQAFFVEKNLCLYLAVVVGSFLISHLLLRCSIKPAPKTSRAWLTIDRSALVHNLKIFQSLAPHSSIMAVVKDNAYGHGMKEVAKVLKKNGVNFFAVATLDEAIALRKSQPFASILILGYTEPQNAALLSHYRLIQTAVDLDHALALNAQRVPLRVHVKVDTGMHRLGYSPKQLHDIIKTYQLPYLKVQGIYSHLYCADSLTEEDCIRTVHQKQQFDEVLTQLEKQGIQVGLRHLQSTYGCLYYPEFHYDAVRIGLGLYGVAENNECLLTDFDLKPVLSLHAKVASVKTLQAGESVSYGHTFTAATKMKIATVTIGYGDGLPLTPHPVAVSIHHQSCAILGRLCMDQLMIDCSHIDHLQPNDTVTLIGQHRPLETVASECNTISNQLLSNLSPRLPHVYIH